jgi:hypothetical protein
MRLHEQLFPPSLLLLSYLLWCLLAPPCLREVCARPVVPHASTLSLSHAHKTHTHIHTHSDDPGQAGTLAAAVRTDHRTCARASRAACKPACLDYGACSRLLPPPCACYRACFRLRGCQRLGENVLDGGCPWHESAKRQPWLQRLPPAFELFDARGVLRLFHSLCPKPYGLSFKVRADEGGLKRETCDTRIGGAARHLALHSRPTRASGESV